MSHLSPFTFHFSPKKMRAMLSFFSGPHSRPFLANLSTALNGPHYPTRRDELPELPGSNHQQSIAHLHPGFECKLYYRRIKMLCNILPGIGGRVKRRSNTNVIKTVPRQKTKKIQGNRFRLPLIYINSYTLTLPFALALMC